MSDVFLIVSLDTEEDNWYRSRDDVTTTNIREVTRVTAFLERLGVRPTFFTTFQIATDPGAAARLQEASARSGGEIAAHLHPWNTPPLTEGLTSRNSMLSNLPANLQLAKLRSLTAALEYAFGNRPQAFRAGRYGLGSNTIAPLLRCGYQVDSSVTPFVSWTDYDDGPTFVGAPLGVYRLEPNRPVTEPVEAGALIEVPLSCGFGRRPFSLWGRLHRALDVPGLRRLRGLCKLTVLSPELASVEDMLTLSRLLIERGVRHLHLTWHTPSLKPGLSPFTATTADVARLYDAVAAYVDGLSRMTTVTMVTVSEAASALAGPSDRSPGR